MRAGLPCVNWWRRRHPQRADRAGADVAIIIGDREVVDGKVILKLMGSGNQLEVPLVMLRDTVMTVLDRLRD